MGEAAVEEGGVRERGAGVRIEGSIGRETAAGRVD